MLGGRTLTQSEFRDIRRYDGIVFRRESAGDDSALTSL